MTCLGVAGLTASLLLLTAGPAGAEERAQENTSTLQNVFVEFDDTSAVADYTSALPQGPDVAARAAAKTRARIDSKIADILGGLGGAEGERELYRTTNAVPGVAIRADAATATRLASRPGVRSVRRITDARPSNASADQLGRTLQTWQDTGRLGHGVRIGIIDTGIDYTHADFGGTGTVAAYGAARAGHGTFPTAKVVGGVDLAGDDYDSAATDPAKTVPKPDDDPLDCEGHGTHVAGTAAGFGVNADGTTFRGDYAGLTPEALNAMRIGPGAAPQAELYAIRVFGCSGATALTPLALDRALDPNGDGDFSDRLDVVNLSLGSDFAPADDPVNDFVQELIDHGVTVVAAAGNGGDITDAAGAPATAPGAIAVANVRDAGVLLDGADVVAPEPRRVTGQYSVDFHGTPDATGDVVALPADDAQGCTPFSGVAGKIVWLEWPEGDGARTCGSAVRADNAKAAGATGVLLTSSAPEPGGVGIAGNATVPMFQLDGASTAALRPVLQAGTLRVHLDGTLAQSASVQVPGIADTISESSARGGRGPGVKPDVAAPGESIVSAAVGTGAGRSSKTGTSMASPFVAGVAALVREAHPEWSPAEVKTAIVTTAADVHGTAGGLMAPMRVGSGRVDARAAVDPPVLAADAGEPGAVGVAFGVVEVPAGRTATLTRTLHVSGAASLRYEPLTTMPGVTISVEPAQVTGPADVTVRLTAQAEALRKTLDPTMAATQGGRARQFVADASGRIVLTAGGREVRVPVTSAPKPVADQTATVDGDALVLAGTAVDQGSGAQAYRSRAGVFRLLATSPELPRCRAGLSTGCVANDTGQGGDVRWVGAARSGDTIGIAVSMWGTLPDVGATTVPTVGFDVDGDGSVDRAVGLVKEPGTDVLVARVLDLRRQTPDGPAEVDSQPVNGFEGDTDTNVFDTDTWVLPVRLSALGVDPAARSAPLRMQVVVEGDYGPTDVTNPGAEPTAPVDVVDVPQAWDPLAEPPSAEPLLRPADAGTRLPAPAGPLLVVLPQNATGAHAAALDGPAPVGAAAPSGRVVTAPLAPAAAPTG
ncbi:S8 family serine peptidase [Pseudonocardia sp. RS11V-5]|uniref:S8 family peptidase n=1 Tax=Pseudonocardia terrae TaxID=2905831 RepID=UPI001E5196A3|nr:S8 family serine peptidase [Pseudonocardia terrae]MCE3554914.1 S8 family serine peptidase [Pseudonocardia terrae]